MTISAERLGELEALHAKATPGEWYIEHCPGEWALLGPGKKYIGGFAIGTAECRHSAATVAALHNAFPDLLARIAEQDRVIARRGELLRICRHVIRATEDDLAVVDRQNVCEVIAAELAGSGEETPAGAGREGE